MGAITVHWSEMGNDDGRAIVDEADFDPTTMVLLEDPDFELQDEEAPEGQVVSAIADMHEEDPGKEEKGWWSKGGEPNIVELRRRLGGLKLSASDRDEAYIAYLDTV